jgi:hypothetical protein
MNENEYDIDQATYNSLSNSETIYTLANNVKYKLEVIKKYRTYYDYENSLNEKKRKIKMIKPNNVAIIEKEFEGIMINGR